MKFNLGKCSTMPQCLMNRDTQRTLTQRHRGKGALSLESIERLRLEAYAPSPLTLYLSLQQQSSLIPQALLKLGV